MIQIVSLPSDVMSIVLEWLEVIGGVIIIFMVIFMVIGLPMWLYETRQKNRKFQNAFSGRQPLDAQTFYEKYFQAHGVSSDIVIKIRNIFEEVLEADLSRLQATDDLTKNLSFFFDYDSIAGEELVAKFEEEFQINITFTEARDAHSIEEIVNLIWLKVNRGANK